MELSQGMLPFAGRTDHRSSSLFHSRTIDLEFKIGKWDDLVFTQARILSDPLSVDDGPVRATEVSRERTLGRDEFGVQLRHSWMRQTQINVGSATDWEPSTAGIR